MTQRFFPYTLLGIILAIAILMPVEAVKAKTTPVSVSNIKTVVAPPTCDVRSTKKWMHAGDTTKIVWESRRADYLGNFMSDTSPRPAKGSQRVTIAFVGKHEFPLTFVGPGGKTTCIAKVFVHPKKKK